MHIIFEIDKGIMDTHFLVTPHLIIDTEWNVCWTCFIYFFAVLHWTFLYCMLFKFMINISFQLATGSHNMAIYLRTLHVFDFFWFVMEKIQRATHRFLINLLVCIVFFYYLVPQFHSSSDVGIYCQTFIFSFS